MAAKEAIDYKDRGTHPIDYMMEGKPPLQERVTMQQRIEYDHTAKMDAEWKSVAEAHEAYLRAFAGQSEHVVTAESPLYPILKKHLVTQNEVMELGCIDERCPHQGLGKHIGLGGAGILVPEAMRPQYVSYLVDVALRREVKTIKVDAHEGCGAAKLFLKSQGIENPTDEQVNQAARQFAETLADDLRKELERRQIPAEQVTVESGFLSFDEMDGPADFHNAVGAMVATTGWIDPTREKGHQGADLPPMFNVNGIFDIDHAVANVSVALGIVFGSHGFGVTRYSTERPFVITIKLNNADQASVERTNALREKIDALVKTLPQEQQERVVVNVLDVTQMIAEVQ